MRSLVALAFLVATAAAQCAVTNAADAKTCSYVTPTSGTCTPQYFLGEVNAADIPSALAQQYEYFMTCTSQGATGADKCCPDPCGKHTGTDACAADYRCAALPVSSSPTPYAAATSKCVLKGKLCHLLSVANPNDCELYSFCFNDNGLCNYQNATAPGGAAALEDLDAKCGGLHPMVTAMLVLMFLTFVGGIAIVVITVIKKKKEADEDAAKMAN